MFFCLQCAAFCGGKISANFSTRLNFGKFLKFWIYFKSTRVSTVTYYSQQVTSEELIDGTGFAFNVVINSMAKW